MEQLGAEDLRLANRLIEYHPQTAANILARSFKDDRFKNEANACFVPPPKKGQPEPGHSSNRLRLPSSRAQARSQSSQSSASSPTSQRRSHHIPDPLSSIPSPPRTVSSTGSRSTKGETASRDYILVLTGVNEQGICKEKPVRTKTAPIPYSIIRDDVADRLGAEIYIVDEFNVPIPQTTDPNLFKEVPVSSSTTLTWSSPKSESTHETRFYIVSRGLLQTDVLFGFDDSPKGHPDKPPGPVWQARQSTYQAQSPAPTAPPASHSHHRSSYVPGASQKRPEPNRVEEFVAQQSFSGQRTGFVPLSQQSPTPTVINSRASEAEPSLPHHPPPKSHIPVSGGNQHTGNRRLRLELKWDRTLIKTWLELDNPAEAFFDAFQKDVRKQRSLPDRSLITILLKAEPNDHSCPLSLNQEDLEADWAGTVSWLEENSREKSPHVFGTMVIADAD